LCQRKAGYGKEGLREDSGRSSKMEINGFELNFRRPWEHPAMKAAAFLAVLWFEFHVKFCLKAIQVSYAHVEKCAR
jgi:hypothetical protein